MRSTASARRALHLWSITRSSSLSCSSDTVSHSLPPPAGHWAPCLHRSCCGQPMSDGDVQSQQIWWWVERAGAPRQLKRRFPAEKVAVGLRAGGWWGREARARKLVWRSEPGCGLLAGAWCPLAGPCSPRRHQQALAVRRGQAWPSREGSIPCRSSCVGTACEPVSLSSDVFSFEVIGLTEPWPRLPRGAVESPSLEIFQPRLDAVLCPLLWVTLLGQGGWAG